MEFNHRKTCLKQIGPPCTADKFKLAVFTLPVNALACAMTCDPCHTTKFKGYIRVFIYVGAGYLIHPFHALKSFRTTSGSLGIGEYTIGEVPSLK